MDLVVDANVFIAAVISLQGHTADLFFTPGIYLHAPELLLEEIEEHKEELVEKSKMSEEGFDKVLLFLKAQIRFVPLMDLLTCLPRAKEISPDPDDMAYFALALKLSCSLWSNDKRLKFQSEVKVLSTSELLQLLSTRN